MLDLALNLTCDEFGSNFVCSCWCWQLDLSLPKFQNWLCLDTCYYSGGLDYSLYANLANTSTIYHLQQPIVSKSIDSPTISISVKLKIKKQSQPIKEQCVISNVLQILLHRIEYAICLFITLWWCINYLQPEILFCFN